MLGIQDYFKPLTSMSDQDRISILNYLNKHQKNCMIDSEENYKFDLGSVNLAQNFCLQMV